MKIPSAIEKYGGLWDVIRAWWEAVSAEDCFVAIVWTRPVLAWGEPTGTQKNSFNCARHCFARIAK